MVNVKNQTASAEYHLSTLANGLRVVTVEMPHLHSAEMMCYVGVGSRNEEDQLAGISHFLEHMIFRGTAEYPSSLQLEQAFETIGGAVNASTDTEGTCYHSRLHPDCIAEGARLFASMLLRPSLSDVEVERRIILEEALEDLNERGEMIAPDNLTAQLLWPGHPLSRPTIGCRETISAITPEDLRAYHRRYYHPANTVIAVAGRVRPGEVLRAVEEAFAAWPSADLHACLPAPAGGGETQPESIWIKDSDSQINLQLAFRLPGRHAREVAALRLLRAVLSWGGASRLMLRLREMKGLTYNVEANLALLDDCGCLTVDLAVAPDNLTAAVAELLLIFEELCQVPVGEEELRRVVQSYLFALDFSRDHTDDLATRYGWGELVGCVRTLAEDRREMQSVEACELRQTAAAFFTPGALKLAVVGPFRARDRREVEKMLKRYRQG
ncbi:insulinase family protein [Desulfuromonas sp. KJ2020]|uniref:M16 family metallopeptidase n=1 Tax=Desulfuromonas sp. KJ2020 TaxID=2919173 RepID=UPI0020A82734|nr:pitrilysin family protein [Desulfuromonas sp. KJ2020]MCP3176458.1 insulinase family protein [Desulfuromonas sp. KJ2020]